MTPTTTRITFASAMIALGSIATTACAEDLKPLRVSMQPTTVSLPLYVATEKGWWAEAGLKVTFSSFAAGAAQIAASKSWDVGLIGSPPAVLGAVRFGLQTIAFTDDQSTTVGLYVRGPKAAAILKDPAALKGATIGLTPSSSGDLAARTCLKKFGLAKTDVTVKAMGQPEMVAAMQAGTLEVGSIWAPYTYVVEEKAEAKSLCNVKDAGAALYGAIVTRGDWAKQNSDEVARFLAVYLRAQRFIAANRKEAVAIGKKAFEADGVAMGSDAGIGKELDSRPTFPLAAQLAMFSGGGTTKADTAMGTVATFLKEVGTLRADEAMPEPKSYVVGDYLKLVDQTPSLKAFATKSN